MSEQIFFISKTASGTYIRQPATVAYMDGRIEFLKSPYSLRGELKALQGSKWHGYDEAPRKIWSCKDTARNRFQLDYLQGKNPYEWWERPLITHSYERPLMAHQKLMCDWALTYHYGVLAAAPGVGKTLSAIEVMERSGHKDFWWVGPKSGLRAAEREFTKWGLEGIDLQLMTYEALKSKIAAWDESSPVPHGVIFDESSRLKNLKAQRSQAAYALANGIREAYDKEGYVILMSGTPAPKSPVDWHSQGEIAWPGFIREGDADSFARRLALWEQRETSQGIHLQRVTWLDNEAKCATCGAFEDDHLLADHSWTPSINEVAYLNERLKGLVLVLHMKDCVDLPELQYRQVQCPMTSTIERVAKGLVGIAPNAITGLTWLRELSDGFQYREEVQDTVPCPACTDGTMQRWVDPNDSERVFEMLDLLDADYASTLVQRTLPCLTCEGSQVIPHKVRVAKEIPCPKDQALRDLLDENEEQGRIVIFTGFTASLDRVTKICLKDKWAVIQVDGRGWKVWDVDGHVVDRDALDYWADMRNAHVAFVAHPKSGGASLTLTEARMVVFFSNDFSGESRSQSERRIHRIGMDMNRGATIVDLIHLPTDERVREVLKSNRKLELMTLGDLQQCMS